MKRNEFLIHATTGINLESIMLSKIDQSQKNKYSTYVKNCLSGISKFVETECKIEVGSGDVIA